MALSKLITFLIIIIIFKCVVVKFVLSEESDLKKTKFLLLKNGHKFNNNQLNSHKKSLNHRATLIKCDYWNQNQQCKSTNGLRCDLTLGHCVCLDHDRYVKLNNGKCLIKKSINEKCTATIQCHHIKNSACLMVKLKNNYKNNQNDKDSNSNSKLNSNFKLINDEDNKINNDWTCQCLDGYWFDTSSNQCKIKLNYSSLCTTDDHCQDGLKCVQQQNQQQQNEQQQQMDLNNNNLITACLCPIGHFYNKTLNQCQHLNQVHCQFGYQFNQITFQCEETNSFESSTSSSSSDNLNKNNDNFKPSSSSSSSSSSSPISSIKNSRLLRSLSNVPIPNRDADTDQKILEIILEISFLIVCLLAYQACSKACCPSDNDDDLIDIDLKSDEESIIGGINGSGSIYSSSTLGVGGGLGGARRKRRRKTRRVFCKSRTNSQQKLVSSPVISTNNNNNKDNDSNNKNQVKDLIVKFDDKRSSTSSTSSCYNCRIYQQVYSSPTVKCKLCRETKDSNSNANDSSDHNFLPLPPYKPIRRSEEVGVPPHLKAPYINNQPFWLK